VRRKMISNAKSDQNPLPHIGGWCFGSELECAELSRILLRAIEMSMRPDDEPGRCQRHFAPTVVHLHRNTQLTYRLRLDVYRGVE
jgi:hypothetical protein